MLGRAGECRSGSTRLTAAGKSFQWGWLTKLFLSLIGCKSPVHRADCIISPAALQPHRNKDYNGKPDKVWCVLESNLQPCQQTNTPIRMKRVSYQISNELFPAIHMLFPPICMCYLFYSRLILTNNFKGLLSPSVGATSLWTLFWSSPANQRLWVHLWHFLSLRMSILCLMEGAVICWCHVIPATLEKLDEAANLKDPSPKWDFYWSILVFLFIKTKFL